MNIIASNGKINKFTEKTKIEIIRMRKIMKNITINLGKIKNMEIKTIATKIKRRIIVTKTIGIMLGMIIEIITTKEKRIITMKKDTIKRKIKNIHRRKV